MKNSHHDNHVRTCISSIINELYFKTADDTYIVARWCSIQRLSSDFIWNAIHALEKYMKAAILLNGGSVKNIGHDIECAYEELEKLAADILPSELKQPEDLELPYWTETTPKQFIKKLMSSGGASVRYNERGYVHTMLDLFLLDELVFHIRRLCIRLDHQPYKRLTPKTRRDFLKNQPEFATMKGGRLEKIRRDKNASPALKQAAFNLNMRFAPEDFDDEGFRMGTSASNPALGRYMVRHLESSKLENRKIGMAVREWYFKNNSVQKALKTELSKIKEKK